jgi:hypothetical protein
VGASEPSTRNRQRRISSTNTPSYRRAIHIPTHKSNQNTKGNTTSHPLSIGVASAGVFFPHNEPDAHKSDRLGFPPEALEDEITESKTTSTCAAQSRNHGTTDRIRTLGAIVRAAMNGIVLRQLATLVTCPPGIASSVIRLLIGRPCHISRVNIDTAFSALVLVVDVCIRCHIRVYHWYHTEKPYPSLFARAYCRRRSALVWGSGHLSRPWSGWGASRRRWSRGRIVLARAIRVEHPDILCIVCMRRGLSGCLRIGDRLVPIGNRYFSSAGVVETFV